MPRVGMEPLRRAALIDATIREIGAAGSLDVTVARIAQRAGVSSGLAHHYFGGKDRLFLSAMRHILALYAAEVRLGLAAARGHRARLEAVMAAGFAPSNYERTAVAAWMHFYGLAPRSDEAARLLHLYRRRLRSTLLYDLRPLIGPAAEAAAARLGALIDGLYLRAALGEDTPEAMRAHGAAALALELGGGRGA